MTFKLYIYAALTLVLGFALYQLHSSIWQDGYDARVTEEVKRAGKVAAKQAPAIHNAATAFEKDRHENATRRPVIRVAAPRVCDTAADPAPVPADAGQPDDRPATEAADAAIGRAIAHDALHYADCYALVQRLREAVTAASEVAE